MVSGHFLLTGSGLLQAFPKKLRFLPTVLQHLYIMPILPSISLPSKNVLKKELLRMYTTQCKFSNCLYLDMCNFYLYFYLNNGHQQGQTYNIQTFHINDNLYIKVLDLLRLMANSRLPMFPSSSFLVSSFAFQSLIHFELIFMDGIRERASLTFLHMAAQFSQYHLLKRLSFLYCTVIAPLS